MDLFLWRHADALPGTPDFERALSPFGHQQASKVAEWFRKQAGPAGLADLRLLVSPAVRTRQTVAHFCEDENKIQLCMPLYENATPKEILEILGWPDITAPALIVGHQPQIGILADFLLAGIPHPESYQRGTSAHSGLGGGFRKSALWWLRFEPGQNSAQLVHVMEP